MPDVVQFDPATLRIIEIDASGDNALTFQEIYSEWKAWVLADASRLAYPSAFRYVGSDPISETQSLGTTFFLTNGWRIRPAESSHTLTLLGNGYTDPAGDSPVVNTLGAFNVRVIFSVSNLVDSVFVNSPDIQFSSFENGQVAIDVGSGFSGTEYPNGTRRQPVNNLADALLIAQARGLESFLILSDLTVSGVDVSEMVFNGSNHNKTLTIDASADVEDCGFNNLTLQGVFDGHVHVRDCLVLDVTNVCGHISGSSLRGDIGLGGDEPLHIIDCVDGFAGSGVPTVDCNGSGSALNVLNYRGGLALTNKSGAEEISIDLIGHVMLDATVTGGSAIVHGIGHIELGGATIAIDSGDLVNPALVSDAVWDEPSADHEAAGSMGLLEGRLDAAVSTRAVPGDAMALTSGERTALDAALAAAHGSGTWQQGLSAADATRLLELYELMGLDPTKPLVVTATTRRVPGSGADIDQTIADVAGTVTVQRA
jgi:hypothetical protein